MQLALNIKLVVNYKSQSQKIRVLTENWVGDSIFCPNCGCLDLKRYKNYKSVRDFNCENCLEDYELKSKQNAIGGKVLDGAHRTMIERLTSGNNPNFFLLNYTVKKWQVINFCVIPKHFFVPEMIEKRNPLSPTARRAGYIGCNILLNQIPQTGKIFFVRDGEIEPKQKILLEWKKTLFLREEKEISAKGWLLDVMQCVETFGKNKFSLDQVYAFENTLSKKHPVNKHIKDKIRQQLQVLRNKGYLEFIGRGHYRCL